MSGGRRRRTIRGLAGLLIALGAGSTSVMAGQVVDAPPASAGVTIQAHRVDGLVVDGRLTEAVYGTIEPATDFVQKEPDEGAPATERTDAWVFYDDRYIYIAARC